MVAISTRAVISIATPAHIGRYEVVTQVGEGGMGRAYLAVLREPPASSRFFVLKQLRPELAQDPQFAAMFAEEARIALGLRHPNVVRTYEAVLGPREHFLAMEHLEGLTLSDLLRRVGRADMPIEDHLFILVEVLSGLHYAHGLRDAAGRPVGVVHRDVSPSNVFITSDGQVKLLDFGIAKVASLPGSTATGLMKGKIGYAAPEQCLGQPVDGRADVYAVGVMLWEALARRRRSVAKTELAQVEARIYDREPSIEVAWPRVPPVLAAICRRALAREREARYPDALAFRAELEHWLNVRGALPGRQRLARLIGAHTGSRAGQPITQLVRSTTALPAAPPPGAIPHAPCDDREAGVLLATPQSRAPFRLARVALAVTLFLLGAIFGRVYVRPLLGPRTQRHEAPVHSYTPPVPQPSPRATADPPAPRRSLRRGCDGPCLEATADPRRRRPAVQRRALDEDNPYD